ncbi:MAG: hotdog domain-containing protein [Balneolaceae bacterium]|nr:hotdog domain-containing protein [Balneolaceae bacterium]
MNFYSRKLIKPQDLNAHGTLFGGSVLSWIDEESAIFVSCQLGRGNLVTKFMSEIDFVSSAELGDIIEIGMETVSFGTSSITVRCVVRNKFSKETIIRIDKIVFVHLDEEGRPAPHGVTRESAPQNPGEI